MWMGEMVEKVVDALREGGYKVTPQRVAIVRALTSDRTHPTAEQIYERVKKEYPMMSPATVYKTLDLLKKIGKVQELGFADGGARFDPNMKLHINLVCVRCGRIEDLQESSLRGLKKRVAAASDYRMTGHRVEFYGYCPRCQR